MPTVSLDAVDAMELAELLQFTNHWYASDHDNLNESLLRFVANPIPGSYSLDRLRHDLDRFIFLLRGDDGEGLFDAD